MKSLIALLLLAGSVLSTWSAPLTVSSNARYFTDGSGRAIYLSGYHTWNEAQDFSSWPHLAWNTWVDTVVGSGGNFIRYWNESDAMKLSCFSFPTNAGAGLGEGWGKVSPLAFQRSGTSGAHDGGNKLDCTLYNQTYFDALSNNVAYANSQGAYVAVMFFDTLASLTSTNFYWSAFNSANNVNGALASSADIFTLNNTAMTGICTNYARKLIDTLNSFDNLIWEVANEPGTANTNFLAYMIDVVKGYEATKPKQHLMMADALQGDVNNVWLFGLSTIDVIAPYGASGSTWRNPDIWAYTKPVILDSDHIWAVDYPGFEWVWKSLLRGYHVAIMDVGTMASRNGWSFLGTESFDVKIRKATGDTARYANRMDLANMAPSTTISSTTFALYNAGQEYLVYQPLTGTFTLTMVAGSYNYEWLSPESSRYLGQGTMTATNGSNTWTPPTGIYGGVVLYAKLAPTPATLKGNVTLGNGTWLINNH